MGKLKVVSAKCPQCGAALPIAPGVASLTCRYCENVITVERGAAPPPEIRPRTIYVSPREERETPAASLKLMAVILVVTVVLPLVITFSAVFGPGCVRMFRPFPIACSANDDMEASGTWETTGAVITESGNNCKIHIKGSRLKGSTLLPKGGSNLELTIEDSTIETTDTMLHLESNAHVHILRSTLTSKGAIIESAENAELEIIGATIESKDATAIKGRYGFNVVLNGSRISAKTSVFDIDSNFDLTLNGNSEIKSTDAPAIKTDSNFHLKVENSKLSSANGEGIAGKALIEVTGTGLTLTAPKQKGIDAASGLKLDLTDSSVTAGGPAIECDSNFELKLSNTTVQGAVGVASKNNLRAKVLKKSRIVGTTGNGITTGPNAEITLTDASIEGALVAFKADSSAALNLGSGSRMAGKRGGIIAESGLKIDATNTSIEGGAGPAIQSTFCGPFFIRDSIVKGSPGIKIERATTTMDLVGTTVEGGQKISKP